MSVFSYETKREVRLRVGGYKSELSGRSDRPTEFMHLIHGRSEELNKPENCREVLDVEHLCYHIRFWDHPEKIGLTKAQNIWAINQISARVTQFSYAKGLLADYDYDMSSCLNGWDIYFETNELPVHE